MSVDKQLCAVLTFRFSCFFFYQSYVVDIQHTMWLKKSPLRRLGVKDKVCIQYMCGLQMLWPG